MITDNNFGIGFRIKQLIDNRNLTAYIVSSKLGISEGTMSRMLSGKTARPSQKNIKLLADYFRVSEQYLLTGEDDTKQENTDMNTNEELLLLRELVKCQSRQIDRLTEMLSRCANNETVGINKLTGTDQ